MNQFVKLFLISLLLLAGCNESKTTATSKVDYVKPHAPVEMEFTQSDRARVGSDLYVDVYLSTGIDVEDLVVSASADNAITLLEYPQMLHMGAQKANQQQVLKIRCQPQQDGVFYLNVSATLVYDGQQQTRSFSIPVNVGDVNISQQLKATGVVEQDASGEAIISMPAQQTLRPAK